MLGLGLAGDLLTEGPRARSAAALTRSQGWFGMAIGNLHVIRAMGMLDGAARLIGQAARDARSEQEVVQRRHETIMMISKPARALAQVLIMGAAAWLVLEQSRSPAIIFATSLLFGRALAPIEGAIVGWKAFAMALAAYRRLNGVMSAVTPATYVKALPDRPKGDLVVNNVGAALPGSSHLFLKGVSFCLAPGDCLGIIGPSGSGKSMLGKIIAAISAPTAGSVLLDGIDISAIRDSGEGRRVGYLPQDIDLFGETVKDIIARLDDADLQKVIEAAKLAGIHETIIRLPQAYDTVVVARRRQSPARVSPAARPCTGVLRRPAPRGSRRAERQPRLSRRARALRRHRTDEGGQYHGHHHHPPDRDPRRDGQACHHAGWRGQRLRRQQGSFREVSGPPASGFARTGASGSDQNCESSIGTSPQPILP